MYNKRQYTRMFVKLKTQKLLLSDFDEWVGN